MNKLGASRHCHGEIYVLKFEAQAGFTEQVMAMVWVLENFNNAKPYIYLFDGSYIWKSLTKFKLLPLFWDRSFLYIGLLRDNPTNNS